MLKVSLFSGESEYGPTVVPLFTKADAVLEKYASATLLPDVVRYIDTLRPRQDAQYVLVNAMGAGEYFGSNINGDYFTEASLIHRPDDWGNNPLLNKIRAKDWPYGYPTFYYAHPYAHHRNKDATRAFGEVELAVWNDRMKRVELVTRVDKAKCVQFGGQAVWDKLQAGQFPDVSMGCKVPFDTCSICLDWKAYRAAQETFDPKVHKHPGEAVLRWHKNKHKIRGVSITRADYCDHAKKQMNKILPDGRKVFVYNDYPKFFDISFVFIGADKTAKTMMKIASECSGQQAFWDIGGSAELAEKLGYTEKTAAAPFKPDPKVVSDAGKSMRSFLESQGLPKDSPYAIGAGASMYFQGYRPGLKDLDVYVPGLPKEHIQAVHHGYEVDAHNDMDNLAKGFGDRVIGGRVHRGGLQLMSLPHTLEMKKHLNREKDQADIALLKAHLEKKAALQDDVLKLAFLGKSAKLKRGEITKDVVPSQFAGKAVPALAAAESDLPSSMLETLSKVPLETSLSTTGGLGIVLKPHEFQRIVLVNIGRRDIADDLDRHNSVFSGSDECSPMSLGPDHFMSALARLLMPFLAHRSALAPAIERRVVVISGNTPMKEKRSASSLYSDVLRKIAAAYTSYRTQLLDLAAHSHALVGDSSYPSQAEIRKLATAAPEDMFSPLSVAYLQTAFLNEVGARHVSRQIDLAKFASVERVLPSSTT